MSFQEIFYKPHDFNWELSKRGGVDFELIKEKVISSKASRHIVDMSINGYSSKEEFNFEIEGIQWKDLKDQFSKGEKAQKDSEALTIKRAIRILSAETTDFILNTNCKVPLHKYNPKADKEICHLGGHFVCTAEQSKQLLLLWQEFDKRRNTFISDSIEKILNIRFAR